jgi:urease accessory protein
MKFNLRSLAAMSAAATGVLATAAQAHPGHSANEWTHGFLHPMIGWDHLLAMLAVGIWATQLASTNRRALWAVPATFVSVMAIGALLGMSGLALAGVETGNAASVLVLGVLIAAAVRLPLPASMAIVGAFALLHGHAHGTEMPAAASSLTYGVGFMLATISLHAAGIGAALGAQKLLTSPKTLPLRYAGAAIALCGLMLMVA